MPSHDRKRPETKDATIATRKDVSASNSGLKQEAYCCDVANNADRPLAGIGQLSCGLAAHAGTSTGHCRLRRRCCCLQHLCVCQAGDRQRKRDHGRHSKASHTYDGPRQCLQELLSGKTLRLLHPLFFETHHARGR